MIYARGGQRRTLRSVLSFHTYVDSRDRTQVIKLVSTPLAEPSQLSQNDISKQQKDTISEELSFPLCF